MQFHTHQPTLRRRKSRRRVLALAVVFGGSLGFAACGDDDDGGDSPAIDVPAGDSEETDDTTTTSATEAAAPAAVPNSITLKLIAFQPTELDVAVGTKVSWIQDDVAKHTVTSGTVTSSGGSFEAKPDGTFESGEFAPGEPPFEYTFAAAGEFPFYCAVHPTTMKGVVRVK